MVRSELFIFLGFFLCCPIICLYVLSPVLCCPLRFPYENDGRLVSTSSCLWDGSYHMYVVCVYLRIMMSFVLCVLLFFFVLLPVSMDCPFLIFLYSLTFIYNSCEVTFRWSSAIIDNPISSTFVFLFEFHIHNFHAW
jgi:hypothetical protein